MDRSRPPSVLPLREGTVALWSKGNPYGNRARRKFVLYAGMERLATDTAPDVRNRSYSITAGVVIPRAAPRACWWRTATGAAATRSSVKDGRLVHDYNFVGTHHVVRSEAPVGAGRHSLRWEMQRTGEFAGAGTLSIDGRPCGQIAIPRTHGGLVSFIGFEVGRAPATPVSDFTAPFPFAGTIEHVTFEFGGGSGGRSGGGGGRAVQRQ